MIMYIISIDFCKFAMTINIYITAINNETMKNTSKAKEIHMFCSNDTWIWILILT